MIYDGIGFFGFDESKIRRIKGKKAGWFDYFRIKRYVLFRFIATVAFILILRNEINKFGSVLSQEID